MNYIKKIIYTVILLYSFAPALLVAGQNYSPVVWQSDLHEAPRNNIFDRVPVRQPVYDSKMASYSFKLDTITGSISSVWSAIPTEIKIVGGFVAVCSLPYLYNRFKRWWNPSVKKDEENKKSRDPIDNLDTSLPGSSVHTRGIIESVVPINRYSEPRSVGSTLSNGDSESDSFEALFPGSAARARKESVSSQSSRSQLTQFIKDRQSNKPSVIQLDGITPGDTPGGPDLVIDTPNSFACYQRMQNFLKKEIEQDIVDPNWSNDLIRQTINRINETYGDQLDISQCDDDIFNPILSDILRGASWFSEFRRRRNRVKIEQFKNRVSDATQSSTFSALSKTDGVFVDFFGESNSGPAIVRVAVPEQKSAECGPWSLVNLFSMNEYLKNVSRVNAPSFYEYSKACFAKNFTNGPEDQRVYDKDLDAKARSMGFDDYIKLSVDDGINEGKFPEVYIEILSKKLQSNLLHRIPVNILLQSKSSAEVGQHGDHWSAVSIVFTADMQEPVILLMDSLKNDTELKTKPMVESALREIAAEVARAMAS